MYNNKFTDESNLLFYDDSTLLEALRKNEILFNALWEASPSGLRLLDSNGLIAAVNSKYCSLFNVNAKDILGEPYFVVYQNNGKDLSEELLSFKEKFGRKEFTSHFETEIVLKDNIKKHVSLTNKIIDVTGENQNFYLLSIFTEVKKVDEEISELEKFRSLIYTTPDALLLLDLNGAIIMCNNRVQYVFGFNSIDMAYGKSIFEYLYDDNLYPVHDDLKEVITQGSIINKEYVLIREDNLSIPVEINFSIVVDAMGEPEAISCVIRDVSKRKEAEMHIRKSELRFRSIWENSYDGMRLTDSNGKMVTVNSAFCNLVGMQEHELINKHFYEIYNRVEKEEALELLEKYKIKLAKNDFAHQKQISTTFRSNKHVDVIVTYTLLEFEKGNPMLLSIFHDITERRKAEEELIKSEKLAAIGKMAAYLSHEIKTPLASIKANIEMLGNSLQLDEKKTRIFAIVQKEVKRLDKLLKNVLQFSRDSELLISKVKLQDLFTYINELMETSLKQKNINLTIKNCNHFVRGDYQKLHTVFLHLIENSIDAIQTNGEIEISANPSSSGDSLSIFIKDNGCGISSVERIFDPFFTEKTTGTGLGLAIAKKIIDQHKGSIRLISSCPGETIFEIKLKTK
jgi:PAS domain S-box-containing protein